MRYTLVPVLLVLLANAAASHESGRLLDKLTEKGVLTPSEAAELSASPGQQRPPVDIDAYFRLRWQYSDNAASSYARSRLRYMLRASASADSGPFRVTAGIASGSGADGRSANQTLSGNMGKKNLYLDLAFLQYSPAKWLTLRGGKMPRTLWDPTEMLWDSDIHPEGFSAAYSLRAGGGELFGSTGFYALGEALSNPRDPWLMPFQAAYASAGKGPGLSVKAAVTYYLFGNVRGGGELAGRPSAADGYLRSNAAPGGNYSRGYDAVHQSAELSYRGAGPLLPGISKVSLFGEYLKNTTLSRRSSAWTAGLRAGSSKVASGGEWQITGSLRRLGAESWLDVYPDSDFYGGSTGVEGVKLSLKAALGGGAVLGTDYSEARPISGGRGENLFRTDLSLRL